MSAQFKLDYDKYAIELKDELKIANTMEVPKITKITVSSGVGKATQDKKYLDEITELVYQITGQKPVTTVAKRSIASFKLREGNAIGVKVTLRDDNMYYFLERLVVGVLPRIRDFRGLSLKSFDKQFNYSLGISDHSIFPEIEFDKYSNNYGLQVTFTISANSKEDAIAMLRKFNFPLRKESK